MDKTYLLHSFMHHSYSCGTYVSNVTLSTYDTYATYGVYGICGDLGWTSK